MSEKRIKSGFVRKNDGPASTIGSIPYYPALQRQLSSIAASVLVTYLEIHHPAPSDDLQPSTGPFQPFLIGELGARRTTSKPVNLSLEQLSIDLQWSRRMIFLTFIRIATFWEDTVARGGAARAGREFIAKDCNSHLLYRPYSVTGRRAYEPSTQWSLRRNTLVLQRLTGHLQPRLDTFCDLSRLAAPQVTTEQITPLSDEERPANHLQSPQSQPSNSRLAELMLAASRLNGDMRSTRYQRLDEAGLSRAKKSMRSQKRPVSG